MLLAIKDVFISYAHHDAASAQGMITLLRDAGYNVWWDHDLYAGENWEITLAKRIEQSIVVVVLWSPNSVSSKYVLYEAKQAALSGKLVPLTIKDCIIPALYNTIHSLNIYNLKAQTYEILEHVFKNIQKNIGPAIHPGHHSQEHLVETLLQFKVKADFYSSYLSSPERLWAGAQEYQQRVNKLGASRTFRSIRTLTDYCDMAWLTATLPLFEKLRYQSIIQRNAFLNSGGSLPNRIPDQLRRVASELQQLLADSKRTLSISCTCSQPAALAVLLSMREEQVCGLEFEIDFSGASSVYQVDSAARLKHDRPYDFMITASAAFTIAGYIKRNLRSYVPCFPIHTNRQVMLSRYKQSTNCIKLYIFRDSSSQEQLAVCPEEFKRAEPALVEHFETLPQRIDNLSGGELVSCWEPMLTYLLNYRKAVMIGKPYYNIINLYQHTDYQRAINNKLARKFKELFVYQWNWLAERPNQALGYLEGIEGLLQKFEVASGLRMPSYLLHQGG